MIVEPEYIPQIARQWYQLKAHTCFGGLQAEWSIPLCATFLQESIDREDRYVAVEVVKGKVTAACGVSLVNTITPPHFPIVTEWMWVGKGRPSARVWAECRAWGKAKGATLAHCSIGVPSMNKTKFTETSQWRVL